MLFLLSPLCICQPSWVPDKKKKEGMNEFWNRSDAITMLNKEFGFKGLLYLSRNFVIYLIMGREKWVSCLKISEPLTLPFYMLNHMVDHGWPGHIWGILLKKSPIQRSTNHHEGFNPFRGGKWVRMRCGLKVEELDSSKPDAVRLANLTH